jgi:PPOX class probable F420-dependent enzyme
MYEMTSEQIEDFLKAPRHAVLGTNQRKKSPHLSPVWYLYRNGRVYVSVGANTVKVKNLTRDPLVSICVDGCYPDFKTVTINGIAELFTHESSLNSKMRWEIICHYHKTEKEAKNYFESVKHLPSVLIVVTPNKIIAKDFN